MTDNTPIEGERLCEDCGGTGEYVEAGNVVLCLTCDGAGLLPALPVTPPKSESEGVGELEAIYSIIDMFLTEAKDQDGNERSLDRLNDDRQLAAAEIQALIRRREQTAVQEFADVVKHALAVSGYDPNLYLGTMVDDTLAELTHKAENSDEVE